jgi:nicotinamidase/pyrazinamidase
MKTSLLIIDPQNDFCIPGASLFVKGADEDMHRLSKFILENANQIDSIHVSLDMHLFDDVAHPMYWIDKDGNNPSPFTNISLKDMESGKWNVSNPSDYNITIAYLNHLERTKKFTHTIWPYHCIAGTYGSNIFPTLYSALKTWMEVTKKSFVTHIKGMDRHSEHFGIFQAEYGTEFNLSLYSRLFINDNILVAGQAKSHCVATSLKQILEYDHSAVKRITLLTDTTSNVSGCEHIADGIFETLRFEGMKETTTDEYSKQNLLQTT